MLFSQIPFAACEQEANLQVEPVSTTRVPPALYHRQASPIAQRGSHNYPFSLSAVGKKRECKEGLAQEVVAVSHTGS